MLHQSWPDKAAFPHMLWPTNSVKFAAATMFTLFWVRGHGHTCSPLRSGRCRVADGGCASRVVAVLLASARYWLGTGSVRAAPLSSISHHAWFGSSWKPSRSASRLCPQIPRDPRLFTPSQAGDTFAPTCTVRGEPVQRFLQRHYINAMAALASALKGLRNVVGFGTMNEPLPGYLGLKRLDKLSGPVRLYPRAGHGHVLPLTHLLWPS